MHQLIETKILHSYTRNEIVHNSLKVKYDERNMCEKKFLTADNRIFSLAHAQNFMRRNRLFCCNDFFLFDNYTSMIICRAFNFLEYHSKKFTKS